jgi:hypothetical protein
MNDSFYGLPTDQRAALTEAAIENKSTSLDRWRGLDAQSFGGGHERAALAASLLADQSGVADMGCGGMILAQHLRTDQRYIPVDVVAYVDGTTLCDFNAEPPPLLEVPALACLGLLEYLHDPATFLKTCAAHYDIAVISYAATDTAKPLKNRRAHGWVNDFSAAAVEEMFRATGWEITQPRQPITAFQFIWRLNAHRQ